MRAYGTVEAARESLVDHIEVLFPLRAQDILVLYRDVFGLYRICYTTTGDSMPTIADAIIEYASNGEKTYVQTSES